MHKLLALTLWLFISTAAAQTNKYNILDTPSSSGGSGSGTVSTGGAMVTNQLVYATGPAGIATVNPSTWSAGVLSVPNLTADNGTSSLVLSGSQITGKFGAGNRGFLNFGAGSGTDVNITAGATINTASGNLNIFALKTVLGGQDASSPVAQTLSVQSVVAGTSNTAGALTTHQLSLSTGSAAGGGIQWTSNYAGNAAGTAQNTAVTVASLVPGLFTVGSGTTTAAGVAAGNLGSSGFGGITATGVTPSTSNALLMYNGTTQTLISTTAGGGSGLIFLRPQGSSNAASGVTLDASRAAIRPENDGATSNGTSGFRWSSAFLGSGTAITASAPAIDVRQIWNNGAVAFTAAKINVTSTASAAGSLLFDAQVGGTSYFSVDKTAALSLGGGTQSGALSVLNTSGGVAWQQNSGSQLFASAGILSWDSTANVTGTKDTGLARNKANWVEFNIGTAGSFGSWIAAGGVYTAAAPTVAAGQIGFGGTVATTVGAAGGASALPALPTGYVIINVAGTQVKVPYYNN
jgi:hypothetical protein